MSSDEDREKRRRRIRNKYVKDRKIKYIHPKNKKETPKNDDAYEQD